MEILESLTTSGRALFTECMQRQSFAKNAPVLRKGDNVAGAYFVVEGGLRVYTLGAEGRQATLYRIQPGETCVLAVNALFNKFLYPAWVDADDEAIVGVLPGSVYRTLFTTEPAIQDMTIRALAAACYGLMSTLDQNVMQTVEQRLAGHLLLRASTDGSLRTTQQEIAAQIGTTREVVARLMARFAKDGIVRTGRGSVTLVDFDQLNALSAPGFDEV